MIHLATQQKLTQCCKLILNNKTKCNKINFKYKIKINFKNKNSLKKGKKKEIALKKRKTTDEAARGKDKLDPYPISYIKINSR